MYVNNDPRKVTCRLCKESIMWRFVCHPNVLPLLGATMSEGQFAMASEWMPNGDINQFVKARKDVNWFELLRGATEGLVYMHEQGTAHGDLKGANILIDENGHARLADFGLLAIISDGVNVSSSNSLGQAGMHRWMSPELLDPEEFSLKHSCLTEHSDCYALGMVMYEVLSGNLPFHCYKNSAAIGRILRGERPVRPPGEWFNDDVWNLMEDCWKPNPRDRSKTTDILR
ncbi:kinase-like domain-containing protein, partial [Thelephora terrestris]